MEGRSRLALALAVVALALGLGACGGGDGDSTATTPPTQEGAGGAATQRGEAGFSSRSEPFRTPDGDNSIQTFGVEASDAERQAASAVLESYMRARATRDHAAECRYLSATVIEPAEDLVKSAQGAKGKGCAGALETLLGKAPPSSVANALDGPVDSLRLDSERAFALFHGSDGVDYFIPMALEGGTWKVAGLAPTEFPNS